MKIDQKYIEEIRVEFHQMLNFDDFLALLNKAKSILFQESEWSKSITIESLLSYARWQKIETNIFEDSPKTYAIIYTPFVKSLRGIRYKKFSINKKSGGLRIIYSPVGLLKTIQKCLNLILQSVFAPHKSATGFVPALSIVNNAKVHVNQFYVYNIDLIDFFPSISISRVKACLMLPPFNLSNERSTLAFFIAGLCCTQNFLPQGAPTSPTLSNIVCQKLDRRLAGLAKRFDAVYTRYADDITFSSSHSIYQKDGEFLKELNRIIIEQKFRINSMKTRLQRSEYLQVVTGLVVNTKVNVRKNYIQDIRLLLHIWEKYGKIDAENVFIKNYKAEKGHIKKGNPDFINVLSGKLDFLKMVRGDDDLLYKSLKARFINLTEAVDQDSYEKPLFTEMKELRNMIAESENVPAYTIFSDVTLVQLSLYLPHSLDEMSKISGMDDFKLNKYGGNFLSIILEYCSSHKLSSKIHLYCKRGKIGHLGK